MKRNKCKTEVKYEDTLRERVLRREAKYKKEAYNEMMSKFKHICLTIIPSLINAVFDPTVRNIMLNITRPDESVLTNNCEENEDGGFEVNSENMMDKAIYLEELFRW